MKELERLFRRFVAHGMPIYAGALAYRGLLALVPFALLLLALVGLFGIESSLPRLTAMLVRLRPPAPDPAATLQGTLPLAGLVSVSAIVGLWSLSTGARLLMRALNAAHEIEETRRPITRVVLSVVLLPLLALLTVLATVLLLLTGRVIAWMAGLIGLGVVASAIGPWLRLPLAIGLLGLAVSTVYYLGPTARPPLRAVAAGAAVTVVLWSLTSLGFSLAVSTVLDYGRTYGSLGAAVALLVYLNLAAIVLLIGAEVSASRSFRRA